MARVIPAATRHAAKVGFVRTAAQSLSSVIPTTGIAISLTSDFLVGAGLGAAGAVATAALAGGAAYLSIIAKGVPGAYGAAAS